MRDPHEVRMEREAAMQEAVKNAVTTVDNIVLDHSDGTEVMTNHLTKTAYLWLLRYAIRGETWDTIESSPPPLHKIIQNMVADMARDATQKMSENLTEQQLLEDYILTEVVAKFMDKVRIIPAAALRRWELEHPEIFETG